MSGKERRLTYEGGFEMVVDRAESRRAPLRFGEAECLPPVDLDLAPLKRDLVRAEASSGSGGLHSSFARKRRALRHEFDGEPELCCLNGLLIAFLRRRAQPPECAVLFHRLWKEEGAFLRDHLNLRWQVSSITTFGDHGETEAQRRLGHGLSLVFGMMKLYESERVFSGLPPTEPWRFGRKSRAPLPLDMASFSLRHGGLDVNLLAPLWTLAEQEPVAGPLAVHLLEQLNRDPGTVFRRLTVMKDRRAAKEPKDG